MYRNGPSCNGGRDVVRYGPDRNKATSDDPLNEIHPVNQEVAMTHTHVPGVRTQHAPSLTERENQRAVDIIERAERTAPYCLCGRHMLAVADGDAIWLECSTRTEPRSGVRGFFSRIADFGHSRRMIMELPAAI
jgi:hypothetical protein